MKLTSALFQQDQWGKYRLPHTLTQGDKLILLITDPAQESLSGEAQRFVARGTFTRGVVLTAESDIKLPVKGTIIGLQ